MLAPPLPKVAPRILRRAPGSVAVVPPPTHGTTAYQPPPPPMRAMPSPQIPQPVQFKVPSPVQAQSLYANTTPQNQMFTIPTQAPTPPRIPTPTAVLKRPVLKPPLAHGVVVHASSQSPSQAETAQPITQTTPVATNETVVSRPISQIGQPPSQLQIMLQMTMEEIRLVGKTLESKMDAKIEACTREGIATAIKDLKQQFESSEIVGETLSDNLPVFARPDSQTTVEHRLAAKGTRIRLFHPMITNELGYWMATTYVLPNASVAMGYVLVFGVKLDGVQSGLSDEELSTRAASWKGFLDRLSDKDFVPHVGRFIARS